MEYCQNSLVIKADDKRMGKYDSAIEFKMTVARGRGIATLFFQHSDNIINS